MTPTRFGASAPTSFGSGSGSRSSSCRVSFWRLTGAASGGGAIFNLPRPTEPWFRPSTIKETDNVCTALAAILAGSTAVGLSFLATTETLPKGQELPLVDPVLSGNADICRPSDKGGANLLNYYQKVAARETCPFPTQQKGSTATTDGDAIFFSNLGVLSVPVTTGNPTAQRYFDQGLRLAFGFNHAEARRAFRAAQRHDPACAMCYWGEAFVLGPNINAPMDAAAVEPAMAAVRAAEQRAAGASAREQALIAALATRYSDDPKAERAALDQAYAAAMREVAARSPQDDTIQVLHAEALMNLAPWDYWEAGGAKAKGKTDEILAALETVLARNPDHPGAIHYYIHMVEASDRPERALRYARRLTAAMPGAGHIVHMPFHIYYRVGDYKTALEANKAAVAVDEAYIAAAAPTGIYPAAYYPHNVHSLMASAQMAGDGKTAIAAAEKLARDRDLGGGAHDPDGAADPGRARTSRMPSSAPRATVLALADPATSCRSSRRCGTTPAAWPMPPKGRRAAHAEAAAIAASERDFAELTAGGVLRRMSWSSRGMVLGRASLSPRAISMRHRDFEKAARSRISSSIRSRPTGTFRYGNRSARCCCAWQARLPRRNVPGEPGAGTQQRLGALRSGRGVFACRPKAGVGRDRQAPRQVLGR